jgi:N-acetylmuramic acid 6-phosphate (MurNAc-6-P) etherase
MAASSVTVKQGREQLGGVFSNIWTAKGTINFGPVADGDEAVDTIAVPGVALGDVVIGVSASITVADLTVTAFVSAANVVTVSVANNTGGSIDLAATAVFKVVVGRTVF